MFMGEKKVNVYCYFCKIWYILAFVVKESMRNSRFTTYRPHYWLEKTYSALYNINWSLSGLERAVYTCIEYLFANSYTPNLLIDSFVKELEVSLEKINNKNDLQAILQQLSDYIYKYTYKSSSSSVEYFLWRLHTICDYLEKKIQK